MGQRLQYAVEDLSVLLVAIGLFGGGFFGVIYIVGSLFAGWNTDHITWWITLACLLSLNAAFILAAVSER